MSRTSASATSAMTRALRKRCFLFAAAAGARAGFQRGVQIDMRRLPGGNEPKDDARWRERRAE